MVTNEAFLDFLHAEMRRRDFTSARQFAAWLGVSNSMLAHVLNGTRIQALNQRRSAVENAARRAVRQSVSEQIAIDRLRDTITGLWERPPAEINQLLHAVFGRWRIVVQDNHPVGLRSLA